MQASSQLKFLTLLLAAALSSLQLSSGLNITATNAVLKTEETGDDLGQKLQLQRNYKVSLTCKISDSGSQLANPKIKWRLPNNSTIEESRFSINEAVLDDKKSFMSTLTIKNPVEADIGSFGCNGSADGGKSASGVANIYSAPMPAVSEKSFDIVRWPGDEFAIDCRAFANPPADIKWLGEDGNGVQRQRGELKFEKVEQQHRGEYVCQAKSNNVTNTVTIFLRVKNPQDYVLPLIIVAVELVVLAVIIAVYEVLMRKRRQLRDANKNQ